MTDFDSDGTETEDLLEKGCVENAECVRKVGKQSQQLTPYFTSIHIYLRFEKYNVTVVSRILSSNDFYFSNLRPPDFLHP